MATTKTALESRLAAVCGFAVELTVRGEKEFTLSADGDRDFAQAVAFLTLSGRVAAIERVYDEECDMTCVYLTVA